LQKSSVDIGKKLAEVDTLRIEAESPVSAVAERCRARLQALDECSRMITALQTVILRFISLVSLHISISLFRQSQRKSKIVQNCVKQSHLFVKNMAKYIFNRDCVRLSIHILHTLVFVSCQLEALGRPQLKPELEQTNQLLLAATQWLGRLDEKAAEQRADAEKLRDQMRAGVSNEKDNEHAIQVSLFSYACVCVSGVVT
jgi:hypothetical protein